MGYFSCFSRTSRLFLTCFCVLRVLVLRHSKFISATTPRNLLVFLAAGQRIITGVTKFSRLMTYLNVCPRKPWVENNNIAYTQCVCITELGHQRRKTPSKKYPLTHIFWLSKGPCEFYISQHAKGLSCDRKTNKYIKNQCIRLFKKTNTQFYS